MQPFEVIYPKWFLGDQKPYKKEISINEMHYSIIDSTKSTKFYQMLGEDISDMFDTNVELGKIRQHIEFCIKQFYAKHFEEE